MPTNAEGWLEPAEPPAETCPYPQFWEPVYGAYDGAGITQGRRIIRWECRRVRGVEYCAEGNWVQDGVPKRWRCRQRVPEVYRPPWYLSVWFQVIISVIAGAAAALIFTGVFH